MEEKDLPELIDEYLLGQIKAGDLTRLEYLRKTNPEIDLRVRQSLETFQILQYARYKELRQKLSQIDASDSIDTGGLLFRRWIFGLVLVVLPLLGIWIWALHYYSPASLATRYYTYISADSIWNKNVRNGDGNYWEWACRSFEDGDFQTAITFFKPFVDSPDHLMATYAQWNIFLARFGMEGPTSKWREEVNQFEATVPEPFRGKANKLLHIIDSPFYQVLILKLSPQLSVLRPRLM